MTLLLVLDAQNRVVVNRSETDLDCSMVLGPDGSMSWLVILVSRSGLVYSFQVQQTIPFEKCRIARLAVLCWEKRLELLFSRTVEPVPGYVTPQCHQPVQPER